MMPRPFQKGYAKTALRHSRPRLCERANNSRGRLSHIVLRQASIVGILLLVAVGAVAAADADDGQKKVVIPFDFVSNCDYGQAVGEMIWKKLGRQGGFIIPETMLDVRDTVSANHLKLTPDTPLDKVAKIVRDDFGGQIAIWGSVERVPGNDWDVYDLKIRCVDFSTPKPTVIYSVDAQTKTVSEIPHLYVAQMLDKLYGRPPSRPAPADPLVEENWKTKPNLIAGGDFERASGGVPVGWDLRGGQKREPLGNLVRWVTEEGNSGNHVIRLSFDKALGDTFGVMYYSDFFEVHEGATYRFSCRWRSDGPSAKVFIKGYDATASKYLPEGEDTAATGAKGGYVPRESERRECYRSQQNLKGPPNTWNTHTAEFTPRHTKHTPYWGRVMLYGYLGAGSVEFDDVVIREIIPASPAAGQKIRRHSMKSGVTVEEMRENEQRGKQQEKKAKPRR